MQRTFSLKVASDSHGSPVSIKPCKIHVTLKLDVKPHINKERNPSIKELPSPVKVSYCSCKNDLITAARNIANVFKEKITENFKFYIIKKKNRGQMKQSMEAGQDLYKIESTYCIYKYFRKRVFQ